MDRDQTFELGRASLLPSPIVGLAAIFTIGGIGLVWAGWSGNEASLARIGASWLVIMFVLWRKTNFRLRFQGNSECLRVEEKKGNRVVRSESYAWKEIAACDLVHYRNEDDLLPGEETCVGKLTPPTVDGKPMAHYRCRLIYRGRPITIFCSLKEGDAILLSNLILSHQEAFAAHAS